MRGHALRVSDEVDPKPEKPRKIRVRLRDELHLAPTLQVGKERTVRDRNFDNPRMRALSPEVELLISARVFRKHFGGDLHFALLAVGGLTDPVLAAAAALVADVLQQFRVCRQLCLERNRPRSRVRPWVLQRDLNFQMAEVGAAITFHHAQRFRVRMTVTIQPRPVIESDAFDHKRVALPAPNRIAHPTWIGLGLQRAAVQEDLTIREIFVEHHDQLWRLNDLGLAVAVDVVGTPWKALLAHVACREVFQAALNQSLRPRLDLSGFEIRHDVPAVLRRNPLPQPRKVRLSIRCARSGCAEIRLPVGRAGNVGSGMIQPLRGQRSAQYGDHDREQKYLHGAPPAYGLTGCDGIVSGVLALAGLRLSLFVAGHARGYRICSTGSSGQRW